jgi:hypothetical protein
MRERKYCSICCSHRDVPAVHKEIPTRCNNVSTFFISYLYEAQHVSGDTPPIIRSLKLH